VAFAIGTVGLRVIAERTPDHRRPEHRLIHRDSARVPPSSRRCIDGVYAQMRETTMVTQGRQDLETVIFDYLGALREGDQEALRDVLDPNVTWQALHEGWVCHGPNEVIETLQEGLRLRRDVSALEFVPAGTRLLMGVRGPSLDEVGGEPLGGQIFNVFTLRNGRIVRIEDYRLSAEALKAAEADEDSGWR
jgi:ketosteroid isomerase-like protein